MSINQWGAANTRCIVDPPCVLQFVCDTSSKDWDLPLVNKDLKCKYYEQVKDKVSANCYCSTEDLTQNSDGTWNLPYGCPEPSSNSAVASFTGVWISLIAAIIVMFAF